MGVQAALDCGIPAEDLKRFIDAEAQQRDRERASWAKTWDNLPPVLPTQEEKAATAAGTQEYDIFSPQPVPRTDIPSESAAWEPLPAAAPANTSVGGKASPAAVAALANASVRVEPAAAEAAPQSEPGSEAAEFDRKAGVMTKKELRALAERRNLDYTKLLADAEAKGIELADG
jgi:hypothetical protein